MEDLNPLKTENLVSEIFNHQSKSIDEFQNTFSEEILCICSNLRDSWSEFQKFEHHKNKDEQHHYLTANIYTLIETQFTSSKLLVGGYISPSGNQFRISIEALATSALLAQRCKLLVPKKINNWTPRDYFADYKKDKRWARPYKSLDIVKGNNDIIHLSNDAIELLKSSKELYNNYSHASFLTMRASIIDENRTIIGGGYVKEQKDIFQTELKIRVDFSSKIPSFLNSLYIKIK